MSKKIALIIGITGQDGSYLSELLINKGYEVHGLVRRSSSFNRSRIQQFFDNKHYLKGGPKKNFFLHYGDLIDAASISSILDKTKPKEIYNLGAQSHVGISFENPEYTGNVNGLGTLRLLEAVKS